MLLLEKMPYGASTESKRILANSQYLSSLKRKLHITCDVQISMPPPPSSAATGLQPRGLYTHLFQNSWVVPGHPASALKKYTVTPDASACIYGQESKVPQEISCANIPCWGNCSLCVSVLSVL